MDSKRAILVLFGSLFLCLFCSNFQTFTDTKNSEYVELERVWQHLYAYSIYSERVPAEQEALLFPSPQALVSQIADTMYSPTAKTKLSIGRYTPAQKRSVSSGSLSFNEQVNLPHSPSSFYRISPNVGYCRINTFLDTFLIHQLISYTDSVKKIPNLIIDLRNNTGGYVNQVRLMVELLLPQQTSYLEIVYRKDIDGKKNFANIKEVLKTSLPDTGAMSGWENKKIIVIMNRYTASASEILISALKDAMNSNSFLMLGDTTFGKGIGQYTFYFQSTSQASLTITGIKFFGIGSKIYHEVGFSPDSIDTSTFSNQLLKAGTWLDSNFAINYYPKIFQEVVSKNETLSIPETFSATILRIE